MCTVNIGVVGQVWIRPEESKASVDFNTRYMGRDLRRLGGGQRRDRCQR